MSKRRVEILSPVDGTLSLRCAEEGSFIEAGERVAEVECMKMLIPLESPAAGRLRFLVQLGEVVAHDEPVAFIEVD